MVPFQTSQAVPDAVREGPTRTDRLPRPRRLLHLVEATAQSRRDNRAAGNPIAQEVLMSKARIDRRQLVRTAAGVAAGGVLVAGTGATSAAASESGSGGGVLGAWWVEHTTDPPADPETGITVVSVGAGGIIVTNDIRPAGSSSNGVWAMDDDRFKATFWGSTPLGARRRAGKRPRHGARTSSARQARGRLHRDGVRRHRGAGLQLHRHVHGHPHQALSRHAPRTAERSRPAAIRASGPWSLPLPAGDGRGWRCRQGETGRTTGGTKQRERRRVTSRPTRGTTRGQHDGQHDGPARRPPTTAHHAEPGTKGSPPGRDR